MKKLLFLKLLLFLILPYAKAQKRKRAEENGAASFYADNLHGRRTSSGERYNRNELTAAHRSLPFGSRVRVCNPKNGKEVVVRINDRGPHKGNRLIDLSKAAAQKLGMAPLGCPMVCLEVIDEPSADTTGLLASTVIQTAITLAPNGKAVTPEGFGLQVSAFGNWENAACQVEAIRKAGFRSVFLQVTQNAGAALYRVLVGEYTDRTRALSDRQRLIKAGYAAIPVRHNTD